MSTIIHWSGLEILSAKMFLTGGLCLKSSLHIGQRRSPGLQSPHTELWQFCKRRDVEEAQLLTSLNQKLTIFWENVRKSRIQNDDVIASFSQSPKNAVFFKGKVPIAQFYFTKTSNICMSCQLGSILDANVELKILHLAAEYLLRPLGAHWALQGEATSVPCRSCETQILRIILFLPLPSRVVEVGDGLNETLYLLLCQKRETRAWLWSCGTNTTPTNAKEATSGPTVLLHASWLRGPKNPLAGQRKVPNFPPKK